jgi:hypothetical protein
MMETIRSTFEYSFGKAIGQVVGGVLVLAIVLLLVALVLAILYLFTRGKGMGFNINFVSGGGAAATPTQVTSVTMAAGQDNEVQGFSTMPVDPTARRRAFVKKLDSFEKVLAVVQISLLYIILGAATFAMAWIYFRYPNDGNRDFMLLLGGVIYVTAVAGLSTQIYVTKRRLDEGSSGPTLADQLGSKVQINVQSSSDVGFIDAASLQRARRHLAGGGTLEEACALVDPGYQQMSGWKKEVFRKAVERSLEKNA